MARSLFLAVLPIYVIEGHVPALAETAGRPRTCRTRHAGLIAGMAGGTSPEVRRISAAGRQSFMQCVGSEIAS